MKIWLMKSKLTLILTIIALFFIQKISFGQAPDLGTASSFAVFTVFGAFTNVGTSTFVTGDVGTNSGSFTGFPPGTLVGQKQVANAASLQAAKDVDTAYNFLSGITCGTAIGTTLGNGQTLTAGVYCLSSASTLNGNLILNGQGNPNALFIIKIGGSFVTNKLSNVILTNSASFCNVYWQINGQFDLGDTSVFRGTVIANGAINLLEGSTLEGRALSIAGAISLHSNIVKFLPDSAGTITGTSSVCQGQTGVIYSVPPITNATSYTWTLPAGATIIAGSGTDSITVNFSSSALSGNITVFGTNACGNGTDSTNYTVTVNPLPSVFSVTGGGGYCSGGSGIPVGLSGSESGVNYQLQINGVNTGSAVSGTGSAISFNNQTSAGTYSVIAINASFGCSLSMSGSAIVTIWPVSSTSAIYHQ